MRAKGTAIVVLLAAQALLLGGCATSALWEDGRFTRYHEPALPLDVRLSFSSQRGDFLVEYAESREDSDAVRQRAFWLKQNGDRLEQRSRPRFVPSRKARELTPIPVYRSRPVLGSGRVSGFYAVVSTNAHTLTLYSETSRLNSGSSFHQELGAHPLPVYRDASGRIKQVLLTPFAVTADATIVGGVIFYCMLPDSLAAVAAWAH